MLTGMLWFDNDPGSTLLIKVKKAADFYRQKYGRSPDLCLVHPSMLEKNQQLADFGKLIIRPYRPVLPGHLWIGIEEKS